MTEKEFIDKWTDDSVIQRLKEFPEDYISGSETTIYTLPSNNLLLGKDLFGKIEISDTNGKSVLFTEDIFFAKYILYSCRNKVKTVKIPKSDFEIKEAVKSYEADIDKLLKDISLRFRMEFPKSRNFNLIANKLFQYWGLRRT